MLPNISISEGAHGLHLGNALALGLSLGGAAQDVEDLVADADHVGQIGPVAVDQCVILRVGMVVELHETAAVEPVATVGGLDGLIGRMALALPVAD
jgi:hypothetical protein